MLLIEVIVGLSLGISLGSLIRKWKSDDKPISFSEFKRRANKKGIQ